MLVAETARRRIAGRIDDFEYVPKTTHLVLGQPLLTLENHVLGSGRRYCDALQEPSRRCWAKSKQAGRMRELCQRCGRRWRSTCTASTPPGRQLLRLPVAASKLTRRLPESSLASGACTHARGALLRGCWNAVCRAGPSVLTGARLVVLELYVTDLPEVLVQVKAESVIPTPVHGSSPARTRASGHGIMNALTDVFGQATDGGRDVSEESEERAGEQEGALPLKVVDIVFQPHRL